MIESSQVCKHIILINHNSCKLCSIFMFTAIGYMCASRLEKKNLERKSEKVREETETQYSSGSLQLEMKS